MLKCRLIVGSTLQNIYNLCFPFDFDDNDWKRKHVAGLFSRGPKFSTLKTEFRNVCALFYDCQRMGSGGLIPPLVEDHMPMGVVKIGS